MSDEFKPIDFGLFTGEMTGASDDHYFEALQSFISAHPELRLYVERNLRKDSICFDVGANIGATTIMLSRWCSDGHVYAFEPSPVNAAFLRKNLARNGVENCTVIEAGLGAEAGTLNFHVSHFGAGSHFVTEAHHLKSKWATIPVPVTTIDAFMAGPDAPKRVDFIKMDAEGFEPAVLAGGAETIKAHRLPVFMEFNSWALYFAHQFDPMTFSKSIWRSFLVEQVQPDGSLKVVEDNIGFLHGNMTAHGCVDDLLLTLREGETIDRLGPMTDAAHAVKEEVRALRESTSWRVTAPLRAAKTLIGG